MTKRTGASLIESTNNASTATMLKLGFTPAQAARMVRVRQTLPLAADSKAPQIDARKLWEKIGKPYTRFRAWADHYLKPLVQRPEPLAEISAKVLPSTGGRPQVNYTLSRDLAASLAMQANTTQGDEVRAYFLDMERLAVRLTEFMGIRVAAIVATDNRVTHTLTKRTAEAAKAGKITRCDVRAVAMDKERLLKTIVCEVLTGQPPAYWRNTFGKGVRDVLDTSDAILYSQCWESAWVCVNAGPCSQEFLTAFLKPSYGGKVSPTKYADKVLQPV